jgi:hypothetical protein
VTVAQIDIEASQLVLERGVPAQTALVFADPGPARVKFTSSGSILSGIPASPRRFSPALVPPVATDG